MDNIFKQPEHFNKICFKTYYKFINLIDQHMPEDLAAVIMNELKSSTVEPESSDIWQVEIFIENDEFVDQAYSIIQNLIKEHSLEIIDDIKHERIANQIWEENYEDKLKPIIIERFYVTHDENDKNYPKDKIPIYIKSSRAFGTGDHETTSGCIKLMSKLESSNIGKIFDIGTGSGILSFVARKLWKKAEIFACDIDPQSLEVAKLNSTFNDVGINFFQNQEDNLIPSNLGSLKFDLIVANILQNPLLLMAPEIAAISKNGTSIILSGFLSNQTPKIAEVYQKYGFTVEEKFSLNNWDSLLLKVNSH